MGLGVNYLMRDSVPGQLDGLRSTTVVLHLQRGCSQTCCCGSKPDVNGTTRISRDTRTTGRGFGKIAEICPGDADGLDAQRRAASVGQRCSVCATSCAHSLIIKVQACRS